MNIKCLFGHKWNGCKCERCDTKRNKKHKWILLEDKCIFKCVICGQERNDVHKWNGGKCEKCGTTRDLSLTDLLKKLQNGKEVKVQDFVAASVKKLIELYSLSQNGEGFLTDSNAAEPVRAVGKLLDVAGGFQLMLEVHGQFAASYSVYGAARNLEMVWDGIGGWRG